MGRTGLRGIVFLTVFLVVTSVFGAELEDSPDAGVNSADGGPQVVPAEVKTPYIPQRKTGLAWAEDNYGIDVRTTATAQHHITGEGAMPRGELQELISDYLEGKRMYILATSLDDKPLTTTIEYALDPDALTLSAGSERPTEKLFHMKDNKYVSLHYHKNHARSDDVSLQIRGTVTVFRGPYCEEETGPTEIQKLLEVYDSPYVEVECKKVDPPKEVGRFLKYYAYQYMPWLELSAKNVVMTIPALLIGQFIEKMMMNNMDISVIHMDQVVLYDASLAKEGYNPWQLWVRGQ
jgi:hypothetical protein